MLRERRDEAFRPGRTKSRTHARKSGRVLPKGKSYAGGDSARVPQSEGLLKDTLSRLESQLLCIFANSLEAVLNPKVDVKCSQTTDIYKPRAGSSSSRAMSRPFPVSRGPSRRSGPRRLREGAGPICRDACLRKISAGVQPPHSLNRTGCASMSQIAPRERSWPRATISVMQCKRTFGKKESPNGIPKGGTHLNTAFP